MSDSRFSRKVWDLQVRLFHWLLVFLVVFSWISGEFGNLDVNLSLPWKGTIYLSNMDIHAMLGEGILILLVFRLLWGVVGASTARFSVFVRPPSHVVAEARQLMAGKTPDSVGHNPLGAVMVITLLALLVAQAMTGLFAEDDLFFDGPLSHLVTAEMSKTLTVFHHRIFAILQVLIVLHIVAVIYYLVRGNNLIAPMVTGRKMLPQSASVNFVSWWRAIGCLVASTGFVIWLVNL